MEESTYQPKHLKKQESRKPRRSTLKKVLTAEIILMAVFCFTCVSISLGHINEKRGEALELRLSLFNAVSIVSYADTSYETASEQIKEERDETVWLTKEANYRTGPDTSYEKLGTLFRFTQLKRTGVTYNDWSRVIFNDNECYVNSQYLTTEAPIITDGGQKGQYQLYALSQFGQYGWSDSEIYPLIKLWNRESSWNPLAHNRSSGAHGIPQSLPASKMAAYGSDYYTNGYTQIRWGLNYIYRRYGSPSRAWSHSQARGWY